MRSYFSVPLGICLGLGGPGGEVALADVAPLVVVELYTSEGCSSCPPSDALLAELAEHDDVMPLALHVDYWDYIGWADRFAHPEFTTRQRAYAQAEGNRTVYTPQMIVAGDERVVGTRPMEVAELIHRHKADDNGIALALTRSGGALHVSATARAPLGKAATIALVRYIPQETVSILRGENAGRTLTYRNIVTSWQEIGTWDGTAPLSLTADAAGTDGVVVIVQRAGPGDILAASRLK